MFFPFLECYSQEYFTMAEMAVPGSFDRDLLGL